MHPILQYMVRRTRLPKPEDMQRACSSAVVTLAEMTSLSPEFDLKIAGDLEQRRSRQDIRNHVDHCFRICPDLEK